MASCNFDRSRLPEARLITGPWLCLLPSKTIAKADRLEAVGLNPARRTKIGAELLIRQEVVTCITVHVTMHNVFCIHSTKKVGDSSLTGPWNRKPFCASSTGLPSRANVQNCTGFSVWWGPQAITQRKVSPLLTCISGTCPRRE